MTDTNTRRVMVERRHGWEGASPALLARVFNVSVQRATAITNERCAACGQPICGHRDDEWAGQTPKATVTIDTESEPGAWDRFLRQCHGEPGQHQNSCPPIPTGDRDGTGPAQAASCVNAAAMAGNGVIAAKSGPVAISQVSA
jgi:hypothetical protein